MDNYTPDQVYLPASLSYRWINCTPSAKIEQKFNSPQSKYAKEGIVAHSFAELELRHFNNEIDDNTYKKELRKLTTQSIKSLSYSKDLIEEMQYYVDKYVSYVKDKYNEALGEYGDSELLIEQRFDLSEYLGKGNGIGDSVIASDKSIEIVDLKYGMGVMVDAQENSELMLHALGAVNAYDLIYEIEEIKLTIIQPRLDHFSTFVISADDLLAWGESQLKPKVKQAILGEGSMCVGSWCKFCKAAPMCRPLAEHNKKLASHDFKDPQLLTEAELIQIHSQIQMLKDWANSVDNYVLQRALEGHKWEGYKVVSGNSNRRWIDSERVISILSEFGYGLDTISVSKLKGIPAIEKLIGSKDFNLLLRQYVEKPEGKPTLVPDTDRRPEVDNLARAKKAFEDR